MERITDNELKALEEAERDATPGEWEAKIWCSDHDNSWSAIGPEHKQSDEEWELDPDSPAGDRAENDAHFVALARNLMPKLMAEIRELRAQVRSRDIKIRYLEKRVFGPAGRN